MSDARPAIVGVGNLLMGDDGVGPAAIEALRRAGLDTRAELIDAGLAFPEVLCDLAPSRPLVIVDAVRPDGRPGSLFRLTPEDLAAESGGMAPAVSLHEVSILPALRMEALAGRARADVTIFGIECRDVAWGEGLSAPVAAALEKLVGAIRRYLDERAAAPARPAACGSENA